MVVCGCVRLFVVVCVSFALDKCGCMWLCVVVFGSMWLGMVISVCL